MSRARTNSGTGFADSWKGGAITNSDRPGRQGIHGSEWRAVSITQLCDAEPENERLRANSDSSRWIRDPQEAK